MNKEQRKKISEALDVLLAIQEEEQGKYDNAPEGLQGSDSVEKFQENADSLQEAIDILQPIADGE